MTIRLLASSVLAVSVVAVAQPVTVPAGDAFTQQADAVVRAMRFSDADKTDAVIALTADYTRQLKQVLDTRQAKLKSLGEATAKSPEVDQQISAAWKDGRKSALALRDAYVAQLNGRMTPYQVERIKDGLTRDWFPKLVELYDDMVPGLTQPQRAHVAGLLTEMRENTMLELDAKPQEEWAKKYRGIINNYIAKQGHDFNKLAKEYDAKHEAKK